MGELSLSRIANIILQDHESMVPKAFALKSLLFRILNPGIGASSTERDYHDKALKLLLESDFIVSTADGDSNQLWESREKPPDLDFYLNTGMILALTGVSVLAHKKRKVSRRKFLGFLSKAAGGAAAITVGEWLRSLTFPSPIPLKRSVLSDQVNDAQIALERTEFLGDGQDATLGTFTEILIERRNEMMALNYWHTIALTSGDIQHQNRILAYMGRGHGKAIDNFLEGPNELEQKLSAFAESLLTDGLIYTVESSLSDKAHSEADHVFLARNVILGWANFFEDATSIGTRIPTKTETHTNIPTAKTVFIDVLISQLEILANNDHRSQTEEIIFKALQGAIRHYTENIDHITKNVLPSIYDTLDIAPMTPPPEEIQDQPEIVGMSRIFLESYNAGFGERKDGTLHISDTVVVEAASQEKSFEVPIGLVKTEGKYAPVSMQFIEDKSNETVTTTKTMLTVYGAKKIFDPKTYNRVTAEEQLNRLLGTPTLVANLTTDPGSWQDLDYRTSLTMMAIDTLPAFAYSELYLLDGDSHSQFDPQVIIVKE